MGCQHSGSGIIQAKAAFDRINIVTLKFSDDGKLKFRDDGPKFKFADDGKKLKFSDDGTLKFKDDPKLKIADDGVRYPLQAQFIPQAASQIYTGAPFILAIPHHSMAWAQGMQLQPTREGYEALIKQYEATLLELEQAMTQMKTEIDALDAEYRRIVKEYETTVEEYQRMNAGN